MDFIIRAFVADQLQTLYMPPAPAPAPAPEFTNLLDRIDGEKVGKIVPIKRKTVWWFK